MGRTRCVVPGCSSPLGVAVHSFPRNRLLANKWRAIIKSPKLDNIPVEKLHTQCVCYRHFAHDNYFQTPKGRSRLLHYTMPTRNLNGNKRSTMTDKATAAEDDADDEGSDVQGPHKNVNRVIKRELDTSDVIAIDPQEYPGISQERTSNGNSVNPKEYPEIKQRFKAPVAEKVDPQEYLKTIERAVAEMMSSGLLDMDKECLQQPEDQHEGDCSKKMEEERQELLAKVTQLEDELKSTQKTLKSYEQCLEEANNVLRNNERFLQDAKNLIESSILRQWNMLSDEQKRFLETQLMNMIPDDSDIEIVFES